MYFGEHEKFPEWERTTKPTTWLDLCMLESENAMWKSLEETIVSVTASGSTPWTLIKILEKKYRYKEDLHPVLIKSPTDNNKPRLECLAFN